MGDLASSEVGGAGLRDVCWIGPCPLKKVTLPVDLSLLKTILQVLLAVLGLITILLVLLHKGRGGGLSDMFGGGVSSSASASGVAERNLNRLTVGFAVGWGACAIGLGILETML